MTRSSLYNKYFSNSCGKKQKGGGSKSSSFLILLNEKKEFLIAVFSNLIAQIGITYYVMINYSKTAGEKSIVFWGLFLFQLLCIFVLAIVPMPSWLKFIVFSLFSASFGMMLSSLKNTMDPNIIKMALVGTIGIFVTMVFIGVLLILFGIQLGFNFAGGLLMALLLLIISQIVMLFTGTYATYVKIISVLGLFLFSLLIIYDTNHILQREYYGDFVTASLDYYLDIINVFVDLVAFNNNN